MGHKREVTDLAVNGEVGVAFYHDDNIHVNVCRCVCLYHVTVQHECGTWRAMGRSPRSIGLDMGSTGSDHVGKYMYTALYRGTSYNVLMKTHVYQIFDC